MQDNSSENSVSMTLTGKLNCERHSENLNASEERKRFKLLQQRKSLPCLNCWILCFIWICTILTLELVNGATADHGGEISTIGGSSDTNFGIRTLSGEPNYKSVNLTWEIGSNIAGESQEEAEFPRIFTIFYCELQTLGPHRCRSKILEDNSLEGYEDESLIKHYSTQIENLRMATKYSFHIKPQMRRGAKKVSGRSGNMDNEVETESKLNGQTIVIPTKGFSAQATKCLPQASEIEVETGPYFGGKIVVDGGNCGIHGDPKDVRDKYVMRIDHEKCGSVVKPHENTVETFITVQENLGIFTHSTRRFVVLCTFQSGMQTVRASFSVPGKGKGGADAMSSEEDDDFSTGSSDRSGRNRQFTMVDKSGLVLKETTETEEEVKDTEDVKNSIGSSENMIFVDVNAESEKKLLLEIGGLKSEHEYHGNYDRLVESDARVEETTFTTNSTLSYSGLVIAVCLSAILMAVFLFILQRELRRIRCSSTDHKIEIAPRNSCP